MKKLILILLIFSLSTNLGFSQKVKPVKLKELRTLNDSASYALGINLGQSLSKEKFDLNIDVLSRGFIQAYKGDALLFNEKDIQDVMMVFQVLLQEKQEKEIKEKSKLNREKSERFLNENKLKQGVFTTTTGLQFEVVRNGVGAVPKSEDRIRMNYRLKNLDGVVIEDSFERDSPLLMGIPNLISGMREGLMLMQEGSIYRFWIHPDLAYGDSDSSELPAGSMLDFEVELIEVIPDFNESESEGFQPEIME